MTNEQAIWLRKHRAKGYEPIGQGKKYARRGVLHADGTFDTFQPGSRPRIKEGTFEVGVLLREQE